MRGGAALPGCRCLIDLVKWLVCSNSRIGLRSPWLDLSGHSFPAGGGEPKNAPTGRGIAAREGCATVALHLQR
jgi:hypothetical protein